MEVFSVFYFFDASSKFQTNVCLDVAEIELNLYVCPDVKLNNFDGHQVKTETF